MKNMGLTLFIRGVCLFVIAILLIFFINKAMLADNQRFAKENAEYLETVQEILSLSETPRISIETSEDEVKIYHYEDHDDIYKK